MPDAVRRPWEDKSAEPIRLGLLAVAPIYYQTPVYRLIAADPRVRFTAIFASDAGVRVRDVGYRAPLAWDTDMLSGYEHVFLRRAPTNPFGGSFMALTDLDIVREIIQRRFDVLWVHGYNFATFVLAVITQRGCGRSVVFREDQTLIHPRSLGRTLLKEIGLRVLFRNGPAMYMGRESRRWFEHYGVPPARLVFTPHAVDNRAMRRAAEDLMPIRSKLRLEFGLRQDAPVVLTVSRLVPDKQPEMLLEAFARVRQKLQCSLLFVGDGALLDALKRNAIQRRIPDVVFAGFLNQSQVTRAYASADIFALASRRNETWGLVVNEALNFGLPVVVSDKVGCSADLVRDGFSGYIVDCDDVDLLAERLAELVRDEGRRVAFGSVGRDIVQAWNHDRAAAGVLRATELAVGPERWAQAAPKPIATTTRTP